jgi:RNA polymerase sigma factor for flagellar operon FliA
VLELSLREAVWLGHTHIGTEHILLGLMQEGEGVAVQVVQRLGADLNRVRQEVTRLLSASLAAGIEELDQTEAEIPDLPGLAEHTSEIDELWVELKTNGSQTARERLILHYAPLVKYVVGRAAAGLSPTVERADLVSYGMFGLMEAIDKFDVSRQEKFEMYALARIKEALINELRALDWVPRSIRLKAREVEKAYSDLEAKLHRAPTDSEVADHLGITVRELHDVERGSFLDALADAASSDPRSEREGQEMRALVSAAVNSLSEREKIVFALYYFEGLTLAEVGDVLGVTESRVGEIHAKAVQNLRNLLGEAGDLVGKEPYAPTDEMPRCPRCRSDLSDTAVLTTLDLPVQGSDNKRAVSFAYCRRCGTWLGTV